MILHLGYNVSVPIADIIGIFDIDNASTAKATKKFLKSAEDDGMIIAAGMELPKSIVLCCPAGSWQRVYLSPLAPATLLGRIESIRSSLL